MIPLFKLNLTVAVVMLAGLFLTLVLHKFEVRKFIKSRLAIKIAMWIPIYAGFLLFVYSPSALQILFTVVLSLLCLIEVRGQTRSKAGLFYLAYWAGLTLFLSHIAILSIQSGRGSAGLVVAIAVGSVLSDVGAFFMGNFIGVHKLPSVLNNKKSYEGVLGQFIGAAAGILIIKTYVISTVPLMLFLLIGLGSAAGDLANSYVKRRAGIKDWGNGLPGHGGFTDRLSSLAAAFAFSYYAWLLFWR